MPTDVQPADVQPADLASNDSNLRWKTSRAIQIAHSKASKQAIQFVEEARGKMTHPDDLRPAFQVLRALRDPATIPVLCRVIDLRDPVDFVAEAGGPFFKDYYPAAHVLVEIGKKAANVSVRELRMKMSDQRRECFCWVIGRVEGPQVGRYVLKLAIDQETDAGREALLNEAVSVFEKLFPLDEVVPAK